MKKEPGHKNYSAEDIRLYLEGKLSAGDMHEMEKAALEDPFLADAIDGMREAMATHGFGTIEENLGQIRRALGEKTKSGGRVVAMRKFHWWQAAAVITILAIGSYAIYISANPKPESENIAVNIPGGSIKKQDTPVAALSTKDNKPDTTKESNPPPVASLAPKKEIAPDTRNKTVEIPALAAKEKKALPAESNDQVVAGGLEEPHPKPFRYPDSNLKKQKDFAANEKPPSVEIISLGDSAANGEKPIPTRAEKNLSGKVAGVNTRNPFTYSGRVVDNFNRPVPNASILVYENKNRVITDQQGLFRVSSPDTQLHINISRDGFKSRDYRFTSKQVPAELRLTPSKPAAYEGNLDAFSDAARKAMRYAQVAGKGAEPVKGWFDFDQYIGENQKEFPDEGSGEVVISFVVGLQGELSSFRTLHSLSKSQDEEAIRLIKEGPKWKPTGNSPSRISVKFYF